MWNIEDLRAMIFSGRWWSLHNIHFVFPLNTVFLFSKIRNPWSHIHSPKFVRYVARSISLSLLPSICTASEKFTRSLFIIISPRSLTDSEYELPFWFNFYINFIISICQYYESPYFFVWLIYFSSMYLLTRKPFMDF